MAKAKKLPSGNWRVLLFVGYDAKGKRKYESITAPTAAEANLEADRRKLDIMHGNSGERGLDITVGEAVDRYIDDRDGILSPKTVREYRNMRNNALQGIMHKRLGKLTNADVQRAINAEAKEKSPKSIRNAYTLLSSAIKYAAPDKRIDVILPAKEKKEMTIPTDEELAQLLEAVKGTRLEIPVLLASTAGLRRGEIAALDIKKDIDYKNCTVSVSKAVSQDSENEWITKKPKTQSSIRTVKIPPWVAERIHELKSEYIPQNPANISNDFCDLCKKLGIGVRFHDLRHYYASSLIAMGTPIKYAMKRMGHSSPNMLNNVYAHIMDAKEAEINAASDEWFGRFKPDEK